MAGVSSKEIKTRIRSMTSTRQITKAMEMVASSKLRRAQAQMDTARPYFETLYQTVRNLADSTEELVSPYLTAQDGKPSLFVVIAGDRGLAGGYNGNVLKLAVAAMQGKDVTVLPIGKKAVEFFRTKGYPLFPVEELSTDELSASHCFSLAKLLCKAYLDGQYGEIMICYTNFVSILTQEPTVLRVLPLSRREIESKQTHTDIIYEPDGATVFETIIPEYVGGILYGALCESRAAEQAARRTAMDSATQNADDMIADLNLKYNQARQAAITQEITEIIAGA